jgi:hypothetical protein
MTHAHIKNYGAEEGTRTPTGILPQPPQGCVSTNSTTSAEANFNYNKIIRFLIIEQLEK